MQSVAQFKDSILYKYQRNHEKTSNDVMTQRFKNSI